MIRPLLIALLLALAGCASTPRVLESSGIEAPPPMGWLEHCATDPGPECGSTP